jgi:ribosomal protein S10
MRKYFITIWLKAGNSERVDNLAKQVQTIAEKQGIELSDEVNVTTSKSRITVYGVARTDASANKMIEQLVSAIGTETGLKAKGKLLD